MISIMQNDESPLTPETQNNNPEGMPPPEDQVPQVKIHNSHKKLIIIALVVIVLLVGFGVGAYVLMSNKPKAAKSNTTTQTPKTVSKGSLVYATKSGKTSKVTVLDLDKSTASEEVTFAEKSAFDPSSGNKWEGQAPAADVTADGATLAYLKEDDLIVRTIKTDAEKVVIDGTAGSETVPMKTDPVLPDVSGPAPALLGQPVWSRDGKQIGFLVGHYEGSSMAVIDPATKKFLPLGDTFRYVSEVGVPDKFTLETANKALAETGIFGSYLVKEYAGLQTSTITLDSKKLLTILCPLDEPSTGNSQYLTSDMSAAQLANHKALRDCGESEERTLISVNVADGTYAEVGKGKFAFSMAVDASNYVYLPGVAASSFNITRIGLSGGAASETLKTAELAALTAEDKIDHVTAKNLGKTPVAEVYSTKAGKQSVTVVNLATKKVIATIALDADTAYSTLGLSQ
jgi:hypothetical protein